MSAVRSCGTAGAAEIRLGDERRLSTGTVRRYVTYERGSPVLIQLPTCYTPGGLLHNFDEGAEMTMVPVDPQGAADLGSLVELCQAIRAVARSACAEWVCGADRNEVRACARRIRDVRVFESEDLAADECPVHPGDTVTAIVSPDYVWRSANGSRGGLNIRLVQLLLHTDRGTYRRCLVPRSLAAAPAPRPPPPPPRAAPPTAKHRNPPQPGFRPSVMDIVTTRNALRKTVKI